MLGLSSILLNAREAWNDLFKALKQTNCGLRLAYPAKLSFKINRQIRAFQGKQKIKAQCMAIKHGWQETFKDSLYTEERKNSFKGFRENSLMRATDEH